MTDNKEDIKARLKEARSKIGLTSSDFASKAGINIKNYSSIETGSRTIGLRLLKEIAQAHGLNITWLNTGEGPMMAGDINVSGNMGTIGNIGTGNTAHMTINAYGFQKIIHPDGTVELIPYRQGDKGSPVNIEQIVSEYNTLQREKISWEAERRRLGKQVDQYQSMFDTLKAQLDKE